jgi:phage-related tail fiber protein
MPSQTPNMGLYKVNGETDGNDTFNVDVVLNDNWDKLDAAVGQIQEELDNVTVTVPDASLTEKGIVQLSNATNGTSETMAATPKAVKDAYDRGSAGVMAAAAAQSKADAAETPAGAQAKANAAETNAKSYVDNKQWQKHKVSADDGAAVDISGLDLNNILYTGFYKGSSMGNAPALSASWGYVEVIRHAETWVLQKVYDLHSDRFYMRRRTDSGWTAWESIGKSKNLSDDRNNIDYYVPDQFPTVAAAVAALPKFNAGQRTIYIRPGHYDSSAPEFNGFSGGVISIQGQTDNQFRDGPTFTKDVKIVNNSARFTLATLRFESSAMLDIRDNGNYTYVFDIVKVGGGQGVLVGGGFASIISSVFVGCSTAITAVNGASVVCRGSVGNNNNVGYAASEAIIFVSYQEMTATTLKYTNSGGRIFEGSQPSGT